MTKIIAPALAAATLMACAASPIASANDDAVMARTMVVSGFGEASAEPDMAVLTLGVETQGKTAADALRQNGAAMNATLDKLKDRGVADKDLQTSNLSVNPRYNYDKNRTEPEIIGFTASNTLRVKLRKLDKAGSIIDDVVGVGANRLGGLSFTFADQKPLLNEARRNAIKDAREKAELYASAAGVSLGPILQISDGAVSTPSPRPMVMMREAAMQDSSTSIARGESSLSATISLVYEIQ